MLHGNGSASVLIIDDNLPSAKTLKLVLGAEGFEADCAGTAAEAIKMARDRQYKAALIDIALPDGSGIDVLGELQGMQPDLISIMVTGHASTETSIQALNRGASGYVQKPVEVQHLLNLLRSSLEKKRLEEENWRMLRRLSLLHAIGATVTMDLDPEKTLSETICLVVSLLDLPGGGIWWAGEGAAEPILAASVGVPPEVRDELSCHIRGLLTMLDSDPPASGRPWFDTIVPAADGESWRLRFLPLRGHDSVIGCMAVGGPEWIGGETEETEVLGAVGSQVGVAMENMRLYADLSLAHERLKEAQAQVVQAEKLSAVGRVVSGVAHELNNPLTAIIGYSELVAKGDAVKDTAEIAVRVREHARRCADIVQKLLAYARQHRSAFVHVAVPELVSSAVDATEHVRPGNVEVLLDVEEDMPPTRGDPGGLQQVLVNILVNAYQAMAQSGGTLSIASGVSDGLIELRVTDTGPGIPDETLPRIFDPFFTTKGVGKGTGLGLSVSHGIVSDHGGDLVADNLPEGGAVFTLRLPVGVRADGKGPVPAFAQQAPQDAPWLHS